MDDRPKNRSLAPGNPVQIDDTRWVRPDQVATLGEMRSYTDLPAGPSGAYTRVTTLHTRVVLVNGFTFDVELPAREVAMRIGWLWGGGDEGRGG